MCGLVGIYAYRESALDVDCNELRCIRDHMAARGPDGKGEWFADNQRLGLGHRRLAIIDPEERAAQPMLSLDGRLVIVFNGEIYNYRELRVQLEAAGHRFQTTSDTEVLLHLFADKGAAMLDDLRGMFALVIWDLQQRKMFMARDAYGIKPLYYADNGATLRCASQVKALLAGGKVSREPESAGILGFHLLGSVPEPYTIYREIRQLPAGHFAWADEHGMGKPQTWFSVSRVIAEGERPRHLSSAEDLEQQTRAALRDSVKAHLVADVGVGAFLSAGVDSGSLVGLMRDAGQQDILTITLAFDEFRGTDEDEAPLAGEVAKLYGTDHHTRRIGRQEFYQDLPLILAAMDQPSIDGINTWFVSKAAHEHGLKVAISGLGGDELFGGYPSFNDIPSWVRRFGWTSRFPGLGKVSRRCARGLLPSTWIRSPKAAGILEYGGTWEGAWLLKRGLFMPWELSHLMGEEFSRDGLERLQPLKVIQQTMAPAPISNFGKVAAMESSLYMRNQLLRDADWAGMAHSLEIRLPLVDSNVLRACAPLMSQAGGKWNKSMLVHAPKMSLPHSVVQRHKTGFTTPIGQWIAQALTLTTGSDQDHSQFTQHWSRPWARKVYRAARPLEPCLTP